MTVERDLAALVMDPQYSAYRESLLSQLFVADLITAAWRAGYPPLEIARPDIDFQGYDLVATCGPITRHVQIKAIAGKSGEVDVHTALATKPAGCVVLLLPKVSIDRMRVEFSYRFYGSEGPLVVEGFKAARHTRWSVDEQGQPFFKERQQHVIVGIGRFAKPTDAVGLLAQLFGPA